MVRRGVNPLTTWHTQGGLLVVSFTWGLSYMMPVKERISFSEVFPERVLSAVIPQMWIWGLVLVTFAAVAFIAEEIINRSPGIPKWPMGAALGGHMMLAATYGTLAFCALIQGGEEVLERHGWHLLPATLSAISRPALWGLISLFHTKYARLPWLRTEGEGGPASDGS